MKDYIKIAAENKELGKLNILGYDRCSKLYDAFTDRLINANSVEEIIIIESVLKRIADRMERINQKKQEKKAKLN